MAGTVAADKGETHAAVYSGGIITDLGALGGTYSTARAINDAGEVTGLTVAPSEEFHGFLYSGGNMVDLGAGTLG